MRYSLLEYINCSYCGGDLTCMVPPQEDVATVNKQSYVVLDVLSEFPRETPLVEMIEHFEEEAEALERDDSIEVKNGLLICGECGHWFPIYDFIPELLPDHLRKW
ncbi:MAG: hypothetical protein GY765_30480, partial [bacterium]|nr:hypothetical protein [bacterium]